MMPKKNLYFLLLSQYNSLVTIQNPTENKQINKIKKTFIFTNRKLFSRLIKYFLVFYQMGFYMNFQFSKEANEFFEL